MNTKPLISVIVPIYNAEATLHVTLSSIVNQNYNSIELIFVNDCSTDASEHILRQFLSEWPKDEFYNIAIINHDVNKGVAAARNTGLSIANGDYIYFIDADDWIEPDTIQVLAEHAIGEDAEIVCCNWFLSFNKSERKMRQPVVFGPYDAIQKIFHGSMRWNLWLFLVRKSLFTENQLQFTPGMNMGEDLVMMIKLLMNASKVFHVNRHLYHYNQSNAASLTKTYTKKHVQEVTLNVMEVEKYIMENDFRNQLRLSLDFLKLNIKLPLLISNKKEQYLLWLNWFPEVNTKTMANKELSSRIRVLQWFAAQRQFWAIKLHYYIVVRFVYGIVYK